PRRCGQRRFAGSKLRSKRRRRATARGSGGTRSSVVQPGRGRVVSTPRTKLGRRSDSRWDRGAGIRMADQHDATHGAVAGIRLSLKAKLSLLITSLVVLTVLLVCLFLLRQQQQSRTEEMTKRGLTIAENFAASAKTPLLT